MAGKQKSFLWVNLLLALGAACATGVVMYENYTGLSFGGFGALFILLLLTPSFCALALDVLLLAAALRGRKSCKKAAFWLQILSGLPYTWLLYQEPVLFNLFSAHAVLLLLGLIGLVRMNRRTDSRTK